MCWLKKLPMTAKSAGAVHIDCENGEGVTAVDTTTSDCRVTPSILRFAMLTHSIALATSPTSSIAKNVVKKRYIAFIEFTLSETEVWQLE